MYREIPVTGLEERRPVFLDHRMFAVRDGCNILAHFLSQLLHSQVAFKIDQFALTFDQGREVPERIIISIRSGMVGIRRP